MGAKHLLVIDDNALICEALRGLLGSTFKVTAVTSAEEAIKHAARQRPDLILCDFTIPGMGGVNAVEMFRTRPETAHAPLVIMSGRLENEVVAELGTEHPVIFLQKPFALADLQARLRHALENAPENPER